jgi:hypothetical protein
MIKLREAVITWGPNEGVKVDRLGRKRCEQLPEGGKIFVDGRRSGGEEAEAVILDLFHDVVFRDRLDAKQAHEQFLKIEEYRSVISRDHATPTLHTRRMTPAHTAAYIREEIFLGDLRSVASAEILDSYRRALGLSERGPQ